MLIPGFLISLLTFPGVIAHELGHLMLCRLTGIKVYEYALLQLKNPMGFVAHENPQSVWKGFLISFGPFFLNSLLAVLLAIIWMFTPNALIGLFVLWLAFSIGAHAFPSTGDAKSLWKQTKESFTQKKFWNGVFVPFIILIYIGAILSVFWVNFIYAGVLIFGTQSALAGQGTLQMPEWSNGFENEYASFSYPFGVSQVRSGTDFEKVKSALEETNNELWFLGKKYNTAILVYGDNETPFMKLETYGKLHATLDFDETVTIESQGLKKSNEEWYEIKWIDKSEPREQLRAIEGIVYCKENNVTVRVLGDKFEQETFNSIMYSFECKNKFEGIENNE